MLSGNILTSVVNQKIKQKALHRARIVKGQITGLIAAIDKEQYCTELLHLSLTIQRSLKSLDALLLENHLKTHVRHQMRSAGEDARAIKELIEVYTLSNK